MHDPAVLRSMHRQRFHAEPAIFVAPGRVNLIGEHTDYARRVCDAGGDQLRDPGGDFSARRRQDCRVLRKPGRGKVFDGVQAKGIRHWTDYPMGVVAILAGEGHKIPGFNLSIWSDVPLASGLSSSAALEVATALAVLGLIGAELSGTGAGAVCQRAENEFVGANCGIMDQFISANGKENHALLLDCRDLSFKLAPIPDHVALVIANTMVKHSVAGGDYPTRRRETEAACAVIASHRPESDVFARRDARGSGKWGDEMGPKSLMRARHVISENLRTVAASEALCGGDMKELGRLMGEAHWSYSKDFEGSCVECDAMVDLAQDLPGLIGARLTGGGFGGCTINLVEQADATRLPRRWAGGMRPRSGSCRRSTYAMPREGRTGWDRGLARQRRARSAS